MLEGQLSSNTGMLSPRSVAIPKLTVSIPNLQDINPPKLLWQDVQLPTDVVLLTVKNEEFLACYAFLKNAKQSFRDDLSWVYFGEIGADDGGSGENVKASLVRCFQGPGSASVVAQHAVRILKPKVVVCVGYCGALNLQKVKLGDVVLSAKLATYANSKVTSSGVEVRATITNVSRRMRNLIKCAEHGWKAPFVNNETRKLEKPKAHCMGEIASGPQLVVDPKRREELLRLFPEAIAVEMEGEGLYEACRDLGVEWAVIKGVSDYADDTKSKTKDWKLFSSVMAASVVHHIFSDSVVLKSWSHYSEMVAPKQGPGLKLVTKIVCFMMLFCAIMYPLIIKRNPELDLFTWKSSTIPQPNVLPGGKNNAPTKELDPASNLLQDLLVGDSGQLNYKDRAIRYSVKGRIHSFDELLVYDAEAWDLESGINFRKKHFKGKEEAKRFVVNKLIEKLKTEGILKE